MAPRSTGSKRREEGVLKGNPKKGDLALARRIRAAGRRIYILEDDGDAPYTPSGALRVYQTGGVIESRAFDWCQGTGFQIYLVITNHRPGFAISAFELKLPWTNSSFYWLEDPIVFDGASHCYRFMGNGVLEFKRNLVINHYADVTQTFSSGQSVKGYLLGFGSDPIPKDFPHGAKIPAFLIIYDQEGQQHRSTLELWADRNKTNPPPPRGAMKRKGGLLDKRDPIVDR